MKNIKKPLAVILAFALLLGSFPMAAFAQEPVYDTVDVAPPPVVEDSTGDADPAAPGDYDASAGDVAEEYDASGDSDPVPMPPVSQTPESEGEAEAEINPAYIGFAPFFDLTTDLPDLSAFDVHTGGDVAAAPWAGVLDTLGLGQIWTTQSVRYLETDDVPPTYNGAAVLTIYVWGKLFAEDQSLLGDDSSIDISARIGDFTLGDIGIGEFDPANIGVGLPPEITFSGPDVDGRITWHVEECCIIDPDEPLILWYLIYLEDRPNPMGITDEWHTNFWYSTLGSRLEVRFEPNMNNPFYWTQEEVTSPAFNLTANWNNGSGLNSATIVDRELGITIIFGKNTSPEGYSAAQRPFAPTATVPTGYPALWAPNAQARIVYDDITMADTEHYWYLQWSKQMSPSGYKEYYFTIRNFRFVDNTWQDLTYFVQLDGPGGNKATLGSRTISSTNWFRRSDLPPGYVWDGDHLVFSTPLNAQILLRDKDVPPPPTGDLQITKEIESIYPDQDWYFLDKSWEFTMRLLAGIDEYVMMDDLGNNEFRFRGFVGDSELATTLTFSDAANTVIIYDLPIHVDGEPGTPVDYWLYEFFLFETLDLIQVFYYIDDAGRANAIFADHPTEGIFYTKTFQIVEGGEHEIVIVNRYDHGIGFLNVFKLLDGFPNDWGVDNNTEFYVRIWDVDAGNFLLFYPDAIVEADYDWLPIFSAQFVGTHWCVGNHELGLTYFYDILENTPPVLELPLTVWQRLRLSNLWTGIEYEVHEVRRADGLSAADTDAAWLAFWTTQVNATATNRTPGWDGGTWVSNGMGTWIDENWLGWQGGVAGTEVIGSDWWVPVREIADHLGGDVAWHDDKDWDWGVIYPDDNPSAPLQFNLTETVTITNRYKFHGGDIVFTKILGDNADDWGMDEDTLFHARVRADDGRLLVFVPDDADDYPEDTVWRVIGFLNETTGTYQVLCPVGGANAPGFARTILSFSAATSTRLIEVPVHPFAPYNDILFTIEEVFPASLPLPDSNLLPTLNAVLPGLDAESYSVTHVEAGITFDMPPGGFPMVDNETMEVTITNDFHPGNDVLLITKVLEGSPGDWGVDEDTEFFAAVYRDGDPDPERLSFLWDAVEEVWVWDGYSGTLPTGVTAVDEIPFSVATSPVTIRGLYTHEDIYTVVELAHPDLDPGSFDIDVQFTTVVAEDRTNLAAVITNTFHPGNDVLLITKVLDGFPGAWGVDEDTEFYAAIYREGTPNERLSFIWNPADQSWVYEGYGNLSSLGLTGEPTDTIPFSEATSPVVVRGLFTLNNNYIVEEILPHPTLDSASFDVIYDEITLVIVEDGDEDRVNLIATITNTFIEAYRVFYDPNGGTGTMVDPDNPYQPGDVVTLLANTFTRTGWTFIGWNTAADGSGTDYDEGDTYTMQNADVTFFAQWEEDPGPPDPPDPPRPPRPPVPPPGGFFVDEHIWYLRGYDEGYLRPASVVVVNPNAFTMRPNANITRAEVAMVFYRLLRPEFKNFEPENIPFADVQGHEWFGLAVGILTYYGIFEGDGGLFRPHDPITRRELAVVVSRFDNLADTGVNPYTDLDPSDWAYRYILSATARGWFVGFPDGTFRPGANLTRAEFVTATNRVLERGILLEHIPDDVVEFIDMDGTHWAHADFMEAAHSHDWELHDNGITERWLAITGHGLDAAYNQ